LWREQCRRLRASDITWQTFGRNRAPISIPAQRDGGHCSLSIAQPASAISINDPIAAAAGGIANYYDSTNQFPNTVDRLGV
jgi:hypothetical protein